MVFPGAAGEIRTLGTLLTYTRFPVVLVMTASILLRIVVLDSKNYYTKNLRKVKTQFAIHAIFRVPGTLAILPAIFYTDKKDPPGGVIMDKSIYRAVNTTLIYIERGGAYLMLHRTKKENDCNRDKWIGIGGKFEPGESPEECMLREAKEETGLTLTDYRYRGIVTFVSDEWEPEYMHLFTASGFEGALKTCDEGELAWIQKQDLLALPAWEGDKIFLRLLEKDGPFFSLKLRYAGEVLAEAKLNGRPLALGQREKLLVSACLLGAPCRYDGKSKADARVQALAEEYELIPVCPEELGGLPTPRTPSERLGERVVTADGRDVTENYRRGAEAALSLCLAHGCRAAVLKEKSPSCGCGQIYDGTFSRRLIPGDGVTAALLRSRGVAVCGENGLDALKKGAKAAPNNH